MQKKGHDDIDDVGDVNEDSDVTYDETVKMTNDRVLSDSTIKDSDYDVENTVLRTRRTDASRDDVSDNSDNESADEIDVVESGDENSWHVECFLHFKKIIM